MCGGVGGRGGMGFAGAGGTRVAACCRLWTAGVVGEGRGLIAPLLACIPYASR